MFGYKMLRVLLSVATSIYICMLKVSLAFLYKLCPERCPEKLENKALCANTQRHAQIHMYHNNFVLNIFMMLLGVYFFF